MNQKPNDRSVETIDDSDHESDIILNEEENIQAADDGPLLENIGIYLNIIIFYIKLLKYYINLCLKNL